MSAANNSANSAYWIRKDRADYARHLFKVHSQSFPKIKIDDGFSALASIPNLSSIPWPLYVMALTKSLNPDANPTFHDMLDDNQDCSCSSVDDLTSANRDLSKVRVVCNICSIAFMPLAKDKRGEYAIRDVSGLYKLHKSVDKFDGYPLCSACFYALQNPTVALDYPKQNRKDPASNDELTHSFQMLKRDSNFGYLGHATFDDNNVVYTVPDCARMYSDDAGDPVTLIDDFAK